jgi:hypothetical protein
VAYALVSWAVVRQVRSRLRERRPQQAVPPGSQPTGLPAPVAVAD